jgi:iron complex transport system ATP-binding protein
MTALLEFRKVTYAYGGGSARGAGLAQRTQPLFENLCGSVQPGEMVALMGPNGAGKTTLLKLVVALLQPSTGNVFVEGRDLRSWERRALSRAVALVPQHLEVPFAFRVEELVAQGRVPHRGWLGGLTAQDRAAIESALEDADVRALRHRVFASLSGGERQRVKLAIALAQQPRLMLLDEPTQHLDLGRQMEAMAMLRKLAARGIAIVAAMHDLALVRDNFSSGILLTPQGPAMVGALGELLRTELLERAFSVERPVLERYLAGEREAARREAR